MIYIASCTQDNNNANLLQGKRNIDNISDLYQAIVKEDMTELRFEKDFIDVYFTDTGLASFCENLKYLRPQVVITLPPNHTAESDAISQLNACRTPNDYVTFALSNPNRFIEAMTKLKHSFQKREDELLTASSKMSSLFLQNANLLMKNKALEDNYSAMENQFNDTFTKLQTLVSRINFNYEKDVDCEHMTQVTGSNFDKILYIKEITRIHYLDTFIYYLREQLKILYGVPARLVVIEPLGAYRKASYYPDCVPSSRLSYKDVMSSNIFMAGFQEELFLDILKNANNNSFLIVLDRGGYHVPHVYGDKIEIIYTASDTKDAVNIPNDRLISYSVDTLNIPHIKGFDTLTPSERMHKYSSMPLMQSLTGLLERR